MRDRSILDYPEHAPRWGAAPEQPACVPGGDGPSGGGGAGSALAHELAAGGDAKPGKRGWKGWGASKVQKMKSKYQERRRGSGSGSGSQDGGAAAGVPALPAPGKQPALPPSLGASPASPAALLAPPGGL